MDIKNYLRNKLEQIYSILRGGESATSDDYTPETSIQNPQRKMGLSKMDEIILSLD